jgi:hypothetical protein
MSLVLLGSTSGSVTLQEPAVAGSTVIDLPATSGTMAVLPTATSVLPEASGGTGTTTGYYGFKSRIINGAMVIDQRNAGASVTQTTTVQYPVDRMQIFGDVASKFTGQQSTTVPSGFINSLKITSSSAYTVGAGERFFIRQAIEGLNCTDLDFGKATAKPITVSFWVYSSLTGSFGGAIQNLARDRSYPFSYTISSANTWEQKSVSIAGDTTGTWLTSNDVGLYLNFSMGAGTTYSTTANAWAAGNYIQPTGSTSVVGTNGATFFITGVQLEKGSTATSFDYRPYGTELALCQRYFQKSFPQATAPADNQTVQAESGLFAYDTTSGQSQFTQFIVTMRATPTLTFYQANGRGSTAGQWATYDGSAWTSLTTSNSVSLTLSQNGFTFVGSRSAAFVGRSTYLLSGNYTASAEL